MLFRSRRTQVGGIIRGRIVRLGWIQCCRSDGKIIKQTVTQTLSTTSLNKPYCVKR